MAAVSIVGCCLDVLGSVYLAYDLLDGQHGPLRLVTRAVTYSVLFGVSYGLGLGLFFGIVAGIATGVTVSVELNRAARGLDHYSLPWEATFSAIRAAAFGVGLYGRVGVKFVVAFALLITAGSTFVYSRGLRPGTEYIAARRSRLSRLYVRGTIFRTVGYTAAALICSVLVHHIDHAWIFALRIGLVTGLVTGIGFTFNPYVEYYADNLPQRRLGAFGIGLILCGFALQSLQYWLALLDVHVT